MKQSKKTRSLGRSKKAPKSKKKEYQAQMKDLEFLYTDLIRIYICN